MTTATAEILVKEILPILSRTVPRVVNPTDCEDSEELIADTLATAAEMLQSLEKAGRKIPARSVAFYSIQRAKSGRRAYQSGAADPLSPVFRTRTPSAIIPLDAPISSEGEGAYRTMGDFIGAPTEDPSETALRRIDWESFLGTLATREKQILSCIADGWRNMDIAKRFKVTPARITQLKREIADRIKEFMGADILNEISAESVWQRDVRMIRESEAYYYAVDDNEPEAA